MVSRVLTKRTALATAAAASLALASVVAANAAEGQSSPEGSLKGSLASYSNGPWYADGQFTLTNTSDEKAADWKLELDISSGDFTNHSSWNTDSRQSGTRVVITPKEAGAVLPHQSQHISYGISGDGGQALRITGCALNGEPVQGCGSLSDDEAEAPGVPRNLSAHAMNSTSAHVMWEAPTSGGQVAGYELYRDGRQIHSLPAAQTMVNLYDLKPSTRYEFTVRAKGADGRLSAAAAPVSLTTPASPAEDTQKPTAPKNLRATATGSTAAKLTWTASTDDVGVAGYDVFQGTSKISSVGGDRTEAEVTGLRPATAYTFTVRARDAAGNVSDASNAATVTTEDGEAPDGGAAPGNLTAGTHALADGSWRLHYLDLAWDAPTAGIKRYEVYLDGVYRTTVRWEDGGSGRLAQVLPVGQQPRTAFKVKVRAQLPDGTWSPFSAEKTVTTGN